MRHTVIALTGGIGAGKSVVARILRTMGYEVYDSDSEAKRLMDSSADIKARLRAEISTDVVDEAGVICRRRLAEIVFADEAKLAALNNIVHGAVRQHINEIVKQTASEPFFIETAILYQSGLNELADAEWRVEAPVDIRIDRVIRRSSLTPDQVKARIDAQRYQASSDAAAPSLHIIVNDGLHPLLPQIITLLQHHIVA